MKEVIRPVKFFFWHYRAPFSCCNTRMRVYEVVKKGAPEHDIARCMKCGRQFSFSHDAGGCADTYDKLKDTQYPLAAS